MKDSRLAKLAAMLLIGDGVYALVHPHREPDAWWIGPRVWKQFLGEIADRPMLARSIGAAQASMALLWLIHTGNETDKELGAGRKDVSA